MTHVILVAFSILIMRIGLAGFAGVVAFGAYNYKNRGTMATSMYLMQLRVAAQGTVVGTLSIGLLYQIYTRINHLWFEKDQPKTSFNKKEGRTYCQNEGSLM